MRAYEVKRGTIVQVIRTGVEWYSQNFAEHECKQDNLFFTEEIVVDPLGHVGCGPQDAVTIGGAYAKSGWYGFKRDGLIMLVPMDRVIIY